MMTSASKFIACFTRERLSAGSGIGSRVYYTQHMTQSVVHRIACCADNSSMRRSLGLADCRSKKMHSFMHMRPLLQRHSNLPDKTKVCSAVDSVVYDEQDEPYEVDEVA